MNSLIELLFSIAIGLAVALFVGFGAWAFYPGPKLPDLPITSYDYSKSPSPEEIKQQEQYDNQLQQYDKENAKYNKTASRIFVGISILIYAIGLAATRIRKIGNVFSEGIMIGGIFTAIYALSKSIGGPWAIGYNINEQPERITSFITATVVLVMILVLTYLKFNTKTSKSSAK